MHSTQERTTGAPVEPSGTAKTGELAEPSTDVDKLAEPSTELDKLVEPSAEALSPEATDEPRGLCREGPMKGKGAPRSKQR